MVHQTLDLDFFISQFPLEKLRLAAKNDLMKPHGEAITSPYDIAVVEQLRREAGCTDINAVPTDVFVLAEGEPENRAVTKIGGLPYWPKAELWPSLEDEDESDIPLAFVAQLCFADSRDLMPDLPGDILVIMVDYWDLIDNPRDKTALYFYWFDIGHEELVDASDLPETEWRIKPRYGVRHRTVDYLAPPEKLGEYRQPYLLAAIEGTKIGGVARWIQGPPELEGRFLGTIGSVQPQYSGQYPFVNHPEPMPSSYKDELMWGDAGSLYLMLQDDGTVDWEIQGY